MARDPTLLTPCLNADGPAPAATSSAPVRESDQTATRQPGCLCPLIRGTFSIWSPFQNFPVRLRFWAETSFRFVGWHLGSRI